MDNFKVKCVSGNWSMYFDEDKVYEIREGKIYDENQNRINNVGCYSFEDLNSKCIAKFELIEDVFTQEDLKTGMLVRLRTGEVRAVIKDSLFGDYIINKSLSSVSLEYFNDFKHTSYLNEDIVAVYEPKSLWNLKNFCLQDAKVLWDDECTEMTVKEIEEKLGVKNLRIKS